MQRKQHAAVTSSIVEVRTFLTLGPYSIHIAVKKTTENDSFALCDSIEIL